MMVLIKEIQPCTHIAAYRKIVLSCGHTLVRGYDNTTLTRVGVETFCEACIRQEKSILSVQIANGLAGEQGTVKLILECGHPRFLTMGELVGTPFVNDGTITEMTGTTTTCPHCK